MFQQGAGLLDAIGAADSATLSCANQGLDIDADLSESEHFTGRTRLAEDGSYYLEGMDGFVRNEGFVWNERLVWNESQIMPVGSTGSDRQRHRAADAG